MRLSATQLTTFAGSEGDHAPDGGGCQRKWAYRFVLGMKPEQGASAKLGQEVQNEQLDPYLREGRVFDYTRKSGEIALALATIIPAPRTVAIRKDVSFQLNPDYGYWGEVDVWAADSGVVPGFAPVTGVPLVGDFKTTSDLHWALTDDALRTDVQAILYAANEVIVRRAPAVDLVWWYVRTRKPHRVQRAYARITADQAAAAFDRVDVLGREVARLRQLAPRPEDLPANVRTCDAYGGCPYRNKPCTLSNDPAAIAAGRNPQKETTTMSNTAAQPPGQFLQHYLAGGQPPPPPPPAHAPQREWVQPPIAPGSNGWFVQQAVNEGIIPQTMVAQGGVENAWTQLQYMAPQGWFAAKKAMLAPPPAPPAPPAINPPESALPPAQPVGQAAPAAPPPPAAAPKATRGPGRPAQAPAPGVQDIFRDVAGLAALMRSSGIKRIVCNETQIIEMEIA